MTNDERMDETRSRRGLLAFLVRISACTRRLTGLGTRRGFEYCPWLVSSLEPCPDTLAMPGRAPLSAAPAVSGAFVCTGGHAALAAQRLWPSDGGLFVEVGWTGL